MKKIYNKIIFELATHRAFSRPRRYIKKLFNSIISIKGGVLISVNSSDPDVMRAFDLIKQIKIETDLLQSDFMAYQLYVAVKKTEKLAGDIAEVGVYKGASAKIICEANIKRKVHLFDTFEGLPKLSKSDNSLQFHIGQYAASYKDVSLYLKKYHQVRLYKGVFPASTKAVRNKKFSFVHLDVDLFESTLECLEFFYPRMISGGIIISHDYLKSRGVKKAIDQFFKYKPEVIIELPGTIQCLIAKS